MEDEEEEEEEEVEEENYEIFQTNHTAFLARFVRNFYWSDI